MPMFSKKKAVLHHATLGDVTVTTECLGPGFRPYGYGTLVVGGWFMGREQRFRNRRRALAGHAAWVERVAATQAMAMVRFDQGKLVRRYGTPFALSSPDFEQWSRDHLRGSVRVFDIYAGFVGFSLKEDAAIFMLSEWYLALDDQSLFQR